MRSMASSPGAVSLLSSWVRTSSAIVVSPKIFDNSSDCAAGAASSSLSWVLSASFAFVGDAAGVGSSSRKRMWSSSIGPSGSAVAEGVGSVSALGGVNAGVASGAEGSAERTSFFVSVLL